MSTLFDLTALATLLAILWAFMWPLEPTSSLGGAIFRGFGIALFLFVLWTGYFATAVGIAAGRAVEHLIRAVIG